MTRKARVPRWLKTILITMVAAFAIYLIVFMVSNSGSTVVPEAEGKELVAATSEVAELRAEHGEEHLRVLALAQHRVYDRDLIAELYPTADRDEVTCVIVATAGDDGYVFLQGEDFAILRIETLAAFAERTDDVDPELLARFWLSLA